MSVDIVISVASDGTARCLWTEDLPLAELGELSVQRASHVEFNDASQQWEVRFPGQSFAAFRNSSRAVCLEWEHQEINRQLLEG